MTGRVTYTGTAASGRPGFGPQDMCDRIINLKLYAEYTDASGSRQETVLAVRSDWEPVTVSRADGTSYSDVYVRKCVHKPDITVKYSKVASSVATGIDVYLSNYVIITSDGKALRDFTASGYKLKKFVVTMGYWGQFKDYPPQPGSDYADIKAPPGVDSLVCDNPLYVVQDKLPPENTLHLRGEVSRLLDVPVPAVDDGAYGSFASMKSAGIIKEAGDGGLEGLVRELVLPYYAAVSEEYMGGLGGSVSSIAQSARYKLYSTERFGALAVPGVKDADGYEHPMVFMSDECKDRTITQSLGRIFERAGYTNARYTVLGGEGAILLYTEEDEGDVSLLGALTDKAYAGTVFASVYENKLPAVNNIIIDSTATIVCPYFAVIQPYQRVKFKNRYSVSSVAAYYSGGTGGVSEFYPYSVSISFATRRPLNEVQLYCVPERTKVL